MTVIPVGFPDSQDPGSFVVGNAGPVIGPVTIPAHGFETFTIDPAEVTAWTTWMIDGPQDLWVYIGTTTPTGGEITPQETQMMLPATGTFNVPSINLGGGYVITLGNTTGADADVTMSAFNLLRTGVGALTAPRYTRYATANPLNIGGVLRLPSSGYENQYDRVDVFAVSTKTSTISIRWRWLERTAGAATLVEVTELLATVAANTPTRVAAPVVGIGGVVEIANTDPIATSYTTATAHWSRTA